MKIEYHELGCEEKLVTYGCGKFGWVPSTGRFRFWGQSKPVATLPTKKDVTAWLVARVKNFKL